MGLTILSRLGVVPGGVVPGGGEVLEEVDTAGSGIFSGGLNGDL